MKLHCSCEVDAGIRVRMSPFWNSCRNISYDSDILWANLDKLHEYVKGKTKALSYNEEYELHLTFGEKNLTMLQHAIKIFEPEKIFFAAEPYYKRSMLRSLQLEG